MCAETAPHMAPRSRMTLHVARSTRVVGKRSGREVTTSKNPAPTACAPFWAWPNNVSRLCVAQARGLLSVYKSRGTPLYPFTCARAVGAARRGRTKQGRGGKPERSRSTRRSRQRQDQKHQRARGRGGLPRQGPCRDGQGQLAQYQQSEPPSGPRVPNTANKYDWTQGSGGTSVVACRSLSRS